MPTWRKLASDTASKQYRKTNIRVGVCVGETAAMDHHRVAEQAAIAVWRGLQAVEEMGKKLRVVHVDACYLFDPFLVAELVCQWGVRIRDTNLAVGALACLASVHEGDDAREIGLQGQNLQVEHHLGVIGKFYGNASRLFDDADEFFVFPFSTFDVAFEFPNGEQILIHLAPVGAAQVDRQALRIVANQVENTAAFGQTRDPFAVAQLAIIRIE